MDPARVGQLEMSDVPTPDLDLFEAPEGRVLSQLVVIAMLPTDSSLFCQRLQQMTKAKERM